jgi:hypothetical protein
MNEPSIEFEYPDEQEQAPPDQKEVYGRAIAFAFGLINKSRTEKSALLRLACARYIVTRYEKPAQICRRLKVSRRRFFEVCKELRIECGLR